MTAPSPTDTSAGFTYAWAVTKNGNPFASGGNVSNFRFTPDDNGTYGVSLTATDRDGGVGTAAQTITVTNVDPANVSLTLSAASINEGQSVTLGGSFIDPGVLDTHTVVITCGDGSANTTVTLAAGVFSFSGVRHAYLDNPAGQPTGSFPITVTVTDKDGGSGLGSTSVQVNNVAPTVGAITAPLAPVQVGTAISARAPFTDPGTPPSGAGATTPRRLAPSPKPTAPTRSPAATPTPPTASTPSP